LLKETSGAFDGARTHDLHITSQTFNPLRHIAPRRPYVLFVFYSVRIIALWNCSKIETFTLLYHNCLRLLTVFQHASTIKVIT